MRSEDLKGWLQDASSGTNPVKNWWQIFVRLIHNNFKDRVVP